MTGRTASGMVQEMLDLAPPTARKELPLDTLPITSPKSVSARFTLLSPERTLSSSGVEGVAYTRRKYGRRKRQESSEFKEEPVEHVWSENEEEEEGEESDGRSPPQGVSLKDYSSSSISSCSTNTSDDSGVCSLSNSISSNNLSDRPHHPHMCRNGMSQPATGTHSDKKRFSMKVAKDGFSSPDMFGRQAKVKEKVHDGFFTMRPKKSKSRQPPGMKNSRPFSRSKTKKYQCMEAPEITGPAPMPVVIQHEETETKSLTRQSAMRGKNSGKSAGGQTQPTIMEVSYPLEVTMVTVEFKGVECEVACRGEGPEFIHGGVMGHGGRV